MATTDIITINNKPVAEYNKDDIALCKRFIRAETRPKPNGKNWYYWRQNTN